MLNAHSENSSLGPVVFDHWSHRARFQCRVCHVDVGFAMKANASNIKAIDNARGFYCGACHNGKMVYDGKTVFAACSKQTIETDLARCDRCHSTGHPSNSDQEFMRFAATLPKERFGNGIDWQQAEETGLIRPLDFVPGVSIRRKPLTPKQDFALSAKLEGMPDIIFSHRKHTMWNGCELCHPEIFVGVKKGASHYSMVTISEGKSCGVCHTTVAFPLTDCQRCHVRPVQ